MRKLVLSLCALLWLTSCGSYHTEDYATHTPVLDIRQYLNGPVTAHGIIFDWKGKASRHFRADIIGKWQGNIGTLEEQFVFSDGQKQQRTWTIRFNDDHFFTATAGDVIGIAEGSQHGNAVNMEYLLNHKDQDGTTIHITVDDWLYLTKDNVLLNRSKLYKYGIPVGEILISFSKNEQVKNDVPHNNIKAVP
jgi:hypothetical protein